MASHFNQANVWGRIKETALLNGTNGKPYLNLQLDCGGQYGAVTAYGRLWGEDRIFSLIDHHKANPNAMIRLRGFFSQYMDKGRNIHSNFTYFQWDPADMNQAPRAAFILRGKLAMTLTCDEGRILQIKLDRKGRAEQFEVWVLNDDVFEDHPISGQWQLKGYMQQGAGEDEFGDATGPVRPVVKKGECLETD